MIRQDLTKRGCATRNIRIVTSLKRDIRDRETPAVSLVVGSKVRVYLYAEERLERTGDSSAQTVVCL